MIRILASCNFSIFWFLSTRFFRISNRTSSKSLFRTLNLFDNWHLTEFRLAISSCSDSLTNQIPSFIEIEFLSNWWQKNNFVLTVFFSSHRNLNFSSKLSFLSKQWQNFNFVLTNFYFSNLSRICEFKNTVRRGRFREIH